MQRQKGFTLIELLVVIAIIALLISILMPALAHVRKQAKAVVCQKQLEQWALIWYMYTEDNDGKFTRRLFWLNPLRDYYKDKAIRVCPMATKPESEGGQQPYAAWGIWNGTQWGQTYHNDYGSYGMNGWLASEIPPGNGTEEQLWKTPSVKGAGYIPMFLDCRWYENMAPKHSDTPPNPPNEPISGNDEEMRICCVDRHNGVINGAFVDSSVRKIGLKELWELKWHRNWNPDNKPPPAWPEWMRNFRDF